MDQPATGTLIEGFGDEVVYGITALVGVLLVVAICLFNGIRSRGMIYTIHADNEATVNTVREEINQNRSNNETEQSAESQSGSRDQEQSCPICLAPTTYSIETNCGHVFCGRCMVTYWRYGNWISGLKCPVCRSQVTILLRSFSSNERGSSSEERDEIDQQVNHYNRRYSGQPIPWMDRIRDLPTLLRHLVGEFFSVGGLVLLFRLRILLLFTIAIFYFISPLDLIPEAAFGILGLIDDVFILFLLAIYLSLLYRQFVAERAANAAA